MKNFLILVGVSLASGAFVNEQTTQEIMEQYEPENFFGLWTIIGFTLHRESFCTGDEAAHTSILDQANLTELNMWIPAVPCICDMDFTQGKLQSFLTAATDDGSSDQVAQNVYENIPALLSDEGFCKAGTCIATIQGVLAMLAEPLEGLIQGALPDLTPQMIDALGIQKFFTDGLNDAVGCICNPTANWTPLTVALGHVLEYTYSSTSSAKVIESILDTIPAVMGKVGGLCDGSCFTFLRSVGDFFANPGMVEVLSMLYVNAGNDDTTDVVATAPVKDGVTKLLTALIGESSGSCICDINYAGLVRGVHAYDYYRAIAAEIDWAFSYFHSNDAAAKVHAGLVDNNEAGGMIIPNIEHFPGLEDYVATGMNNAAADEIMMQLPAIIMGSDGLCNNGCQAWFAGVVHATFNFLHVDPASQMFLVSAEDIPQMDQFFGEVVSCFCGSGAQFDWDKIIGAALSATKNFAMKWYYNSATASNEDGFMYSNPRDAPMVDALAQAIADISDGLIPNGFCAAGGCMRLANEFNGWITNSLNMVVQAMGGQPFFMSAEDTFHDCICSGEFDVSAYTKHVATALKQQVFGLAGALSYPFSDGSPIAPSTAGFVTWAGQLADLTFSKGGFCSSGCRSGAKNWVKAIINSISSLYSIANTAYMETMIFPAGMEKPPRLSETFPQPLVQALSLIPDCMCSASSGGTWSALLVKIPSLIEELGAGNGVTAFTKVINLIFGKEFFVCGGTCNGVWNGILSEVAASLDHIVPHFLVGISSLMFLTNGIVDVVSEMEGSNILDKGVSMGYSLLFGEGTMEDKLASLEIVVPVNEADAKEAVDNLEPPAVDVSAIQTGLNNFVDKQCLCAPDTNWLNVITMGLSGGAMTPEGLFTAVSACQVAKVDSILVVKTEIAGVVSDWTPEKLEDFDESFCKNILKRKVPKCWQEDVYTTAKAGSVILETQIKSTDPVAESKVVAAVTEAYQNPEAATAALMVPGLEVLEINAIVKSEATAITKKSVAENTGLSTGAIIGIAAGAGVGGILLIVAIVLLVCKKSGSVSKKEKAIAA